MRIWAEEWKLGLENEIWALRIRFGPQGWDLGLKAGLRLEGGVKKEKEEREKIPHM